MEFLLIFLSGVADRLRGDRFHILGSRIFDKILYGWIVAALINHPFDLFTIGFILLFGIGMSPGWGGPMGCYLDGRTMSGEGEWWQRGFLRTNVHAALWARGLLWALCILPLTYLDYNAFVVAISVFMAFPISLYISKQLYEFNPIKAWKLAEYIRGWMIAGYTYIIILWS